MKNEYICESSIIIKAIIANRFGKNWAFRAITVSTLFLFIFIAPTGVIFTADAQTALKEISFIPQWSPQAQFAGYYAAYEQGIYRKHGLNVRIIQGGAYKPSSEILEKGEADIASIWLSTAIQKRSRKIKLVNIGQIVQRSSLMLIAKKSQGIKTPEDLNGKKIGLWGADFRIQPEAFFKKHNIKVKVIPQSYSVNLFLRDGVDAASAMWYNEYHTILNAGINADELTSFFYSDYGLNFPEDGLYVMEDVLKKDPEAICAFVRASIEGWKYAFDHPDEALDIILRYMVAANVPANRVHQKWMLERMKDIIYPSGKDGTAVPGTLRKEDYDRVAGELKEAGLIRDIPDINAFVFRCEGNVQK
ncbi:MAG: transporter substrate-binding protein [Deltaproteobacteria bacterium]|nr:transporter substrate-binding protein [Deltaproteobacteria bacterium]